MKSTIWLSSIKCNFTCWIWVGEIRHCIATTDIWLSASLWISWFPQLRFCGCCWNVEFKLQLRFAIRIMQNLCTYILCVIRSRWLNQSKNVYYSSLVVVFVRTNILYYPRCLRKTLVALFIEVCGPWHKIFTLCTFCYVIIIPCLIASLPLFSGSCSMNGASQQLKNYLFQIDHLKHGLPVSLSHRTFDLIRDLF